MGRPAAAGGSRRPAAGNNDDGAEVFDFLAAIVNDMELASGRADMELRGKIEELRAVSSASVAQTNASMEQMQQQFAALSRRLGDLDRRVTSAMQDPTMRLVLQGSAPLFSPTLREERERVEERGTQGDLERGGEGSRRQGDMERGEGSQGVGRDEEERREGGGEAGGLEGREEVERLVTTRGGKVRGVRKVGEGVMVLGAVVMLVKAPAVLEKDAQQLQQLSVPSSFDYNEKMKRQMANPYEYHHELGIYYTRVHKNIIAGSQPQTPADIDRLQKDEGVKVILNLQQDHDISYWGVDIGGIVKRCKEVGVEHHRRPAVDFDPNSLRRELPRMVAVIAKAVAEGKTIYVHCTAGLGRSPAAVIAYLFWFSEPKMDLNAAYEHVTSLRPCGPKKDAIRGATYDLAKNSPYQPQFEHLPDFAFTDVAQWERDLIRQRVWGLV
ncbi:unnamed protein product [Closterium sp. Yama58-4]|nr:unnamed protein product [Closterium sp. Yama58-4]